jgi:hypothetical protein
MSGADFRAFLDCKHHDIWPDGLYIEEELLRVNGVETELPEKTDDTDIIEILGGATAWENVRDERPTPALVSLARRWIKMQNELRVLVSVPKDKVDDLRKALKSFGATVVT